MRERLLLPMLLTVAACSWSAEPTMYKAPADTSSGSAYSTNSNDDKKDPGAPSDSVIVEADTPCVRLADGVKLVDAKDAPRFNHLGMVGKHRFASSEENILVFDADGSNPGDLFRPSGADLVTTVAQGSVLAAASVSGSGTKFTHYDDDGAKITSLTLDAKVMPGDPALSIAAGKSSFLTVRARGTDLRGIEIGNSAGDPIDFGSGTFGDAISTATASDASGFAIAWAGKGVDGTWRLELARWNATKTPRVVLSSTSPLRVSKLVPMSTGFALLVNDADVVMVDVNGGLVGKVHRLAGAAYAWDIASNGSELAVVAKRSTGEPMVRTLDSTGAATGAWMCLGESLGADVGGAAVDVDSTMKWAVVHSAADGSARFVRL